MNLEILLNQAGILAIEAPMLMKVCLFVVVVVVVVVLIASQISRLPYDFFFVDLLFCFTNKNVRSLRLILFMGSDW